MNELKYMNIENTPPDDTNGTWTVACESGEWFPTLADYSPIPATFENATLMAAAPKMLAALKFYAQHKHLGWDIADPGKVAEEAIALALGAGEQREK